MVGTEDTRLIVIRSNSASGKSSVAVGLRETFGRNLAIVGQDNLRRIVPRERDRPGAVNIGLIDLTARYALDNGFHVVVKGILYADRYGRMLQDLVRAHRGVSLSVTLAEPTLVIEVSADTAADTGRWRHPVRLVRIRADMAPQDTPPFGGK
ncbi:kinase [Streptomyces decoyicus]|uniref:kinase n=1 Tax=Streptomyces decoyicus TaxID=249567 RepID=UPI0033E2C05B